MKEIVRWILSLYLYRFSLVCARLLCLIRKHLWMKWHVYQHVKLQIVAFDCRIYEFIILRTRRSAGLYFSWRNSWQIIIDRVAALNLRKHHESPRRASVITVRNCKSILCSHPFARAEFGILYPFEVQQRSFSFAVARTKRFVSRANTDVKQIDETIRIVEVYARSIAGNRREALESCEKSSIFSAGAMPRQSSPPGDAFLSPAAARCSVLLNRTSHSRGSKCR